MKLRHFYKIDHNTKQPIPGSNVKRKSSPGRFWKEILDPCCFPPDVDCTCGPRFFVQLDGLGKPVPGTLIKRTVVPRMDEGIKYMEINWKSPCCPPPAEPFRLIWDLEILNTTGRLIIKVGGLEQVNTTDVLANGIVVPPAGSLVEVTLINDCTDTLITNVIFEGGHVFVEEGGEAEFVHNFLWNVTEDVLLHALIDCQQR